MGYLLTQGYFSWLVPFMSFSLHICFINYSRIFLKTCQIKSPLAAIRKLVPCGNRAALDGEMNKLFFMNLRHLYMSLVSVACSTLTQNSGNFPGVLGMRSLKQGNRRFLSAHIEITGFQNATFFVPLFFPYFKTGSYNVYSGWLLSLGPL